MMINNFNPAPMIQPQPHPEKNQPKKTAASNLSDQQMWGEGVSAEKAAIYRDLTTPWWEKEENLLTSVDDLLEMTDVQEDVE
ncbi:hypothetical protein GNF76_03720 [Pseudomonas sp. CCM 7893]|uniref:Uncharacterized protein n=1 Tax=Pseudomonas spelaei TaxID=1055469 RepID=A0A6I3W1Q4_9PSED|nr:hypothetical protein [Pseudomonas spelaei]MUF03428.1 hypothetical protein [Pseudomonas spelaei]